MVHLQPGLAAQLDHVEVVWQLVLVPLTVSQHLRDLTAWALVQALLAQVEGVGLARTEVVVAAVVAVTGSAALEAVVVHLMGL